jgi:uncharacterized protein
VYTVSHQIAVPRTITAVHARVPTGAAMLTEGATADEQALAGQHWGYSQTLLTQGILIFAGRTLQRDPTTFAFAIVRAPSLEAARELAERDPAVAGGVFSADVFAFQPMLMGAWPAEAATAPSAA